MSNPARERKRNPQQARGHRRVEGILSAAEGLLLERGFDGFSMTELAGRLGCTRAAVYKFFPTPQAIFEELSGTHLDRLEQALTDAAQELEAGAWPEQIHDMVFAASRFHNANPVARLLILGAPHGETSYRSLESTIARLGGLARTVMATHAIRLPREPADCAMLAVEIGTACLRTSFFFHGEIIDAYRDEAAAAMIAYLQRFDPGR